MNFRLFFALLLLLLPSASIWAASQTLFLNGASERVVVSHDAALNPSSAITLEGWVRPNAISGCQTIIGKNFRSGYWLGLCNGRVRYYSDGAGTNRDGNAALAVGEWAHVAVTFDGHQRRYYINGELDFSAVTPGSLGINDAALGLGGEGASPSFPSDLFAFSGYLSELRIWAVARSQQELRRSMYQQLDGSQTGLIAVWSLQGGIDDQAGRFHSVRAPGASFSGLDSPPVAHDPLRIRSVASISADGVCNDPGYTTAVTVPAWYPAGDRPLAEPNPQRILLGATATYLYVCLPHRSQLNDPIYTLEIDPDNDAGNLLNNDDRRFRLWPGGGGLTTARGDTVTVPFTLSRWLDIGNPSGLFASETVAAEFVTDMEMRIPRAALGGLDGVFRLRVAHNYLISGGSSDRTIDWPLQSASLRPDGWQQAVIDLTPVGPPDYRNPRVSTRIDDDQPGFLDSVEITVEADDDTDIELVELLIDGLVVEGQDYTALSDTAVSFTHSARYPPGLHSYRARVFDHAGRISQSRLQSFRVLVDGQPPRLHIDVSPLSPAAGQTVTITARAIDPSGVESIILRDVLGLHFPAFRRCDFGGSGGVETCSWSITPDARLTRLRLDALASDSEGFVKDSADRVIVFGNSGPDRDQDGLADHVEAGLCTAADNPDSDGDGLSDGWEVFGIRFADGQLEPLVDYGVNPCWKNVLLQLDYESGATPPAMGIANLRNRYRANDISVFLDLNERPQPTAYEQSHIGATSAVYQRDDGEYYFDPKRTWAFFYGYERNLPGRSGAWNRFFTVDHHIGQSGFCFGGDEAGKRCRGDFECAGTGAMCAAGCDAGSNQGMACSNDNQCPKDDGSFSFCSTPCTTLAGTSGPACGVIGDLPYRLFHEFGHTVGLGHGGRSGTRAATSVGGFVSISNQWDSRNYKPNHQSSMNYLYNQGEICIEPFPDPIPDDFSPRLIGQITYMTENLGDANENALSEHSGSAFATSLRARDCSYASASAFPAFKYTCDFGGVQYEVLSDGLRTLARRPKDGDWDYAPPSHGPGIDWNCNSTIDAGSVAENVNGPGWFSDDFWDQAAWILEDALRGRDEFGKIPNPVACQRLYRANCSDRAASCYVWPSAYQSAIPSLSSGVAPIDCRDVFLANRGGDCGGGDDSEFGTGVCPVVDRDAPVAAALQEKQYGGYDDMAWAKGQVGFNSDQFIEVSDDDDLRPLPGVEQCDLADNDGDGMVDEGCRDQDFDGVPDVVDNCPTVGNGDQADRDFDGLGEACQFPQAEALSGVWDGDRAVTLNWSDNGIPSRGFAIYRYGVNQIDPIYLGELYPSATATTYVDSVSAGDDYTYLVRAINANGEEGAAVSVTVTVSIEEQLFKDSFESL